MLNRDYSRAADRCFDRHGLHALPFSQEMAWSVHMGADMRARRDLREVTDIAICDMQCLQPAERRITGPAHHAVAQRYRDVDELATHDATATTFLMPPASFD